MQTFLQGQQRSLNAVSAARDLEILTEIFLQVCALHGLRLTKRKFYSLAGMPIRDIYVLLAKEQGERLGTHLLFGTRT